jgi:PhnB protein
VEASIHLSFNGQCAAAFKFYERSIGAKVNFVATYGESPMAGEVPPEWSDKIMHATLTVGDITVMGADSPPQNYKEASGFSVVLGTPDLAEAQRLFKALAEGGQVQMEFQKTFWSAGFGILTDQFGIPWMVNCEQEPA